MSNKYYTPYGEERTSVFMWVAWGLGLLITLSVIGFIWSVVSAPGRVVTETLGTNNIITSYEFFRDANEQVKARAAQIAAHKKFDAGGDKMEANRLRIELGAMQQSCRDLVAKYNANASKANKAIFRGDAPTSLNLSTCE